MIGMLSPEHDFFHSQICSTLMMQDTRGARQDEDANRRNGGKTDRPDQARRRGGEEKEKGKR